MDFSPPQKLRRRTYSDRALPSIAALRQELNIVDRGHNPPGKGGYEYMQQQPPGAAPAAPLAPMPVLKPSVSLPAMPPLRMWPAAPWSGGEGVVEIGAPAGDDQRWSGRRAAPSTRARARGSRAGGDDRDDRDDPSAAACQPDGAAADRSHGALGPAAAAAAAALFPLLLAALLAAPAVAVAAVLLARAAASAVGIIP